MRSWLIAGVLLLGACTGTNPVGECGGAGEVCCLDGQGLHFCSGALVCSSGQCSAPVDMAGDMTPPPDLVPGDYGSVLPIFVCGERCTPSHSTDPLRACGCPTLRPCEGSWPCEVGHLEAGACVCD